METIKPKEGQKAYQGTPPQADEGLELDGLVLKHLEKQEANERIRTETAAMKRRHEQEKSEAIRILEELTELSPALGEILAETIGEYNSIEKFKRLQWALTKIPECKNVEELKKILLTQKKTEASKITKFLKGSKKIELILNQIRQLLQIS